MKAPAKLSKKNTNKSIKSKQNLASQAQLKLAKSNQTLQRREEDNFKQAPVENKNIRDSILVEPNT